MANKRKWTAERRRKFLATVSARKKVSVRTHIPNSPDTGLVPVPPPTIDVLIDGKIRQCRVHSKVYVPIDA
jgi:hypothetical protein